MNLASLDATSKIANQYGPFAFGVVSLLVIWYAIMAPELDRKQLDFEQHKTLLQQQHQENLQQAETAETLRDTARVLEKIVDKIEGLP